MNNSFACTLVVGDVHGDAKRLNALLEHFTDFHGTIIMVGDYVNRGPDTRSVLDILLTEKIKRGSRLVLLRGNHEEALLDFLEGGRLADFARHGGLATISSYLTQSRVIDAVKQFREEFPPDHLELVQGLERYYLDSALLVSHAGFDIDDPENLDSQRVVSGDSRIFSFAGNWLRPTVVVGHYLQSSQQPLVSDRLVAIDTGCGTIDGAPLTAVRLPDRAVFQF